MTTLQCKATEGHLVFFQGAPSADAVDDELAAARAFGVDLGEKGTFAIRQVDEADLASVADVLHSAFIFPLDIRKDELHLGPKLGTSAGSWKVESGTYWAALYEVFPDCEETIGAPYVLVLSKADKMPEPRWTSFAHLTEIERTPDGIEIPEPLRLPGDALDDSPMPDLRELFGGASKGGGAPAKPDPAAQKSSDNVASRLFAAIAELGDIDDEDDEEPEDDEDEPVDLDAERDPFARFITKLVASEQLILVEGASARKLAERLELALERDPMAFRRPGDWFFDQKEVDELFASDDELMDGIRSVFER